MFKSTSKIISTITAIALLTACGTNGVNGNDIDQQLPQDNGDVQEPDPIDNGSGYPALPFSFSVYGQQPSTATSDILTDNMLKVKITADAATRNQGT